MHLFTHDLPLRECFVTTNTEVRRKSHILVNLNIKIYKLTLLSLELENLSSMNQTIFSQDIVIQGNWEVLAVYSSRVPARNAVSSYSQRHGLKLRIYDSKL